MSYFALRAAAPGAVPAQVVTATSFSFHPNRVGLAIPEASRAATPDDLLATRSSSVAAALRRLLGEQIAGAGISEAVALAQEAALAAPVAGRPLAAANLALTWPDEPHLVFWQAQTVLRESRGDAHVAALVSAGFDPCEALVLFASAGMADGSAGTRMVE